MGICISRCCIWIVQNFCALEFINCLNKLEKEKQTHNLNFLKDKKMKEDAILNKPEEKKKKQPTFYNILDLGLERKCNGIL